LLSHGSGFALSAVIILKKPIPFMQLNLGDFEIVGIAVRTTNQNGEAEKDIGALWKRF
jgi:hypothetical protein